MSDMLIDMLEEIRLHGLEKVFKRYYGKYRAIVTGNSDSQGRGRIAVRVPGLFGRETLPNLALPCDNRGAGADRGEFMPPNVGDGVFVEFEGGDTRFPLYSGGWHPQGFTPEEFGPAGSPFIRGFKNKYGHSIRFDETDGKEKIVIETPVGHRFVLDDSDDNFAIFLIHDSGAQMQMDNDGNVKIFAEDGSYVYLNAEEGAVSLVSAAGAYAEVGESIKLSDSTGENWFTVDENGVTANATAGTVIQGNSFGVNVGAVDIKDTIGAGLKIGTGLVALGSPVLEIFDALEQVIDALTDGSPLVSTGTGPSSGLLPPALANLLVIKGLIAGVKGSL